MQTLPDAKCPHCGHKVNASRGVTTDDLPSPGDFAICAYCAHVNVYGDDMQMLPATKEDLRILPEEALTQILLAQINLRELMNRR